MGGIRYILPVIQGARVARLHNFQHDNFATTCHFPFIARGKNFQFSTKEMLMEILAEEGGQGLKDMGGRAGAGIHWFQVRLI